MDSMTFEYEKANEDVINSFEASLNKFYNHKVFVSKGDTIFNTNLSKNNNINRTDFFELQNIAGRMGIELFNNFKRHYKIGFNSLIIIGNIPHNNYDDCKPLYMFSHVPVFECEYSTYVFNEEYFKNLPIGGERNKLFTPMINNDLRNKYMNKDQCKESIYDKFWSVFSFLEKKHNTTSPIWIGSCNSFVNYYKKGIKVTHPV